MKAVIMAGGEGSRLRPLTCDLPKPMVPIMNVPVMEHIIDLLKKHGIKDIIVTLMYLPQKIKNYFGDGSSLGVRLNYITEDVPLGTAGSIKNAEKYLDDTFLVISGDSLTDMDITSAIDFHKKNNAKATIILSKVEIPLDYGVVITDNKNRITGFLEKPSWGEVFSDTVNTGTYILEPEILDYFEKGIKFDFSQDLFPMLLEKQEMLLGYTSESYWCDIGDIKAYMQAHHDVFDKKINLSCHIREIRKGIFAGSNTTVEKDASLTAPCFIGSNCHIGTNTNIDAYTVIGNNTIIEDSVSIKRSIVWNHVSVEYGSEIRAAIICNKAKLKNFTSIFENAVIGEKCVINERAIVKPNVKIWPDKKIDSMAIVDRNIIWSSRYTKSIFGEDGISGIINVEVTPEFATRLGAAYGSVFKEGSKVLVSSTTSNAARMFKHAFISGMLSIGLEVFNMSSLLTPMSRHAVNFLPVEGGIHIKVSNRNPNKLIIDFMDNKGAGIKKTLERKIENAFIKEDFRRCIGEEVQSLNNITDYKAHYEKTILSGIKKGFIRARKPSICIVSPSNFVINSVAEMLSNIGCRINGYNYTNIDAEGTILEKIRKTNSDFAAFIDVNGEKLILLDRNGQKISKDLFLSLTTLILFRTVKNATVIVPVTSTGAIDIMAKKYNGKVIRTKASNQAIMEEMLSEDLLGKNEDERLLQFLLNYDALAGLSIIIEFLVYNNTDLSDLLNEIPEFYLSKKDMFCPWEMKGKVMRTLINQKRYNTAELLDGVKFTLEEGWVLVLPDSEMPLCRVYSEGTTKEIAEVYTEEFLERIKTIIEV
jgi:mannose-1-phosphate guanylyltransferase/phosphomannomutase